MRGSEHDKAADEARMMALLHDAVLYRFIAGQAPSEIAARYGIEPWVVEGIIRDNVRKEP
jgi:hypothetical protein